MTNNEPKAKLSVLSLGLAIGIAEGVYMLGFAWLAWFTGVGDSMIQMLAQMLPGYSASFMGGIYGGIEGLIDGFIFGAIVGLVYNCCLCCVCGKKKNS